MLYAMKHGGTVYVTNDLITLAEQRDCMLIAGVRPDLLLIESIYEPEKVLTYFKEDGYQIHNLDEEE